MLELTAPLDAAPALHEQIHAYDLLLVGGCASARTARDLVALGRLLDLDVSDGDPPARIWARLRPLILGARTNFHPSE